MLKRRINLWTLSALLAAVSIGSSSAALNWDGQNGVFLNSLAYPLAQSQLEISTHNADLGSLGSVSTYNVGIRLAKNVEIGISRYSSNVIGVADQNLISAKWQFAAETTNKPAVSAWAIHRDLIGGDNTVDLGISATKIVKLSNHPLVLNLGARSTKALGLGLFGIGNNRKIKLEGSIAYFVTNNFIVATEFKQQIGAETWKDIAFRYIVNDKLNLDAGIADFGPGIDNQIALAATYKL